MDLRTEIGSSSHTGASAEGELQHQDERFELLLNLTTQITSSLDLREVLRAVAASIREVIHADGVTVSLLDGAREQFRVFAVDFPQGKGIIKEELLVTPSAGARKAMDTLKPVLIDMRERGAAAEVSDYSHSEGIKAVCNIPLLTRGRVLGIVSVLRTTETPFTSEDVDFLSRASGQIAIAVGNALAFQEVSSLGARLQLLLNLTNRITSNLDLRDLLRTTSANMRDVVQADAAGVAFFDEASDKGRIYAVDFPGAKGFVKEEVVVTPGHALKRAWRSSKAVIVNANNREELGPEIYDMVIAEGLEAHCLIPLVSHGLPVGLLILARKGQNLFTSEDVDFLTRASGQIAIAIENALAFQKVSRLGGRLQLLMDLTTRITSSLDLREVLRAVGANIREVIHADAVVVSLPDTASGKFRIFAVDFPHGKGVIKEELLVTPSAAVKEAIDTLKPVVSDGNELSPTPHEVAAAEGLKSICSIPLVNRGRALGILSLLRTSEAPFTPEDVEFLTRTSGPIAIAVENAVAYREISELKDKLAQEKLYLEEEFRSEMGFEQIIGNSTALKHVLQQVETVASSDSTVLLLGETGTGKELIARAIHDRSRRKQRTLVKLNCAAIPTGLLESELFGHEKGAFTGAINQKIGRLELADQGTLFLDEVGDIPIEIQPKLLRALQEREFERLGSAHTRKLNVRLVAATNRDLEKMVANKEFRSDLYYRLNVFPIRIPPLRDRKEDIPLLVSHFVQKFAKEMQKPIEAISTGVMKGLRAWDWPGNIRELENFVERAVILTRGKSLEAPLGELRKTNTETAVHADLHEVKQVAEERTNSRSDKSSVADEYEKKQRDQIIRALTACKGRVGGADGAAARLGMNRTTLLSRMKKLGIYSKQYA